MRNILKSIYAVGLGACLFMTSCDEEREFAKPEFATGNNGYVAFDGSSAIISESASSADAEGNSSLVDNTYQVVVYRSSESYDSEVTVGVSMSATYASDSEFAAAGDDASGSVTVLGNLSTLTIPAGESRTSFTVVTTEDLQSAGDINVSFELTSASGIYSLGAAQAAIGTTFSLTIQDDDCPISLADWAGSYTVGDFCGTAGATNEGSCSASLSSLDVQLVPNADDPAGISAFITGLSTDPILLTFNTCPGTVSFDGGPYTFVNAVFGIADTGMIPTDYATPLNFYDESKFEIVITVDLVSPGSNYDAFDLILTKD